MKKEIIKSNVKDLCLLNLTLIVERIMQTIYLIKQNY